jgi:hypothetical protein
MMTVGATLSYLLESIIVLALCSLWVVAVLDIQSQMRRGVSSYKISMFIALAISVLAVYLVVAVDAFFIDSRSEPLSSWSDWGVRLGS